MSRNPGKCGVVDLAGVRSARVNNTPENLGREKCVSKVKGNSRDFYFKKKADGKDCLFRIDTGSDVSLINSKFVEKEKKNS